jgi:UDP-glucose-4-epimerase GalE
MRKILVTGGAGYIGAHCCKALAERGYEPLVFDNFLTGHRHFVQWGEFFEGDIRSSDDLRECFNRHRVDAVLHFAGFIEVGESVRDPAKYYANNVGGSLQLLRAVVTQGVTKFIFSSSAAVYGHPQQVPIEERHPLAPVNPYGWTKFFVEKMLADFQTAHHLCWTALRYFNAAGADASGQIGEQHEPESHLIPRLLNAALSGEKKVSIFGTDYPTVDGTCVRDYIHVSDLARAHVLALDYLNAGGASDVFNLGHAKGYSVKEVIQTASAVTGIEIPVQNEAKRPGDPAELVASNQKAKRLLGWKPSESSLENILQSAFDWHQTL